MDDVLDQSVLDELLSFAGDGDPELLLDLIQMFLEDGPEKVAAVQKGLANGDFDMAERAAHSLKGSSGNLGAHYLQDVCEQLQQSTRNHELERSRELAPRLSATYAQAETALKDLLKQFGD